MGAFAAKRRKRGNVTVRAGLGPWERKTKSFGTPAIPGGKINLERKGGKGGPSERRVNRGFENVDGKKNVFAGGGEGGGVIRCRDRGALFF